MPKRVLIIGHTNTMGGVETFIHNVVLNSDVERVSFDLLIHDGSGKCQYEDEFIDFYKRDGKNHLIHIPPIKKKPLACIASLIRLCRKHKNDYDWVHLNTGAPTEVIYCLPFVLLTKARLISHSHTGDGNETLLNRPCRGILNSLSTYRLACSDHAAAWLFGRGHVTETYMVRNGIDTKAFTYSYERRKRVRSTLGLTNDCVVGNIGRFAEVKNHRRLLRIFSLLRERCPNARLCLVGTGELYNEIVACCKRLGLSNHVDFLGLRSDTSELYSAFDVFVMPSFYEGLPMVLVEAQASGLPIVMSDTISNDAIIIEDLCHTLSLDESDEKWAETIENAECSNRESYASRVEQAGFGIRSIVKALENLYDGDDSAFEKIGES